MSKHAQRQTHHAWSLRTYRAHHKHAWHHGLRQLTKNSLSSLLTIAVISITLVLPTCLLVVLGNMKTATQDWNKGAQISVYMQTDVSKSQISSLGKSLKNLQNVSTVKYISPQQGLSEFAKQSGLNNILQTLGSNPLPAVFKISPKQQTPAALNILQSQIHALSDISTVKVDMQWVKRLNAIIHLLQKFTYGLAAILAIAVLLIIGNTIRMAIQNYHQEIEVMKLVGASNRFIRRPFLYSGVFYGLASAIFAAVILDFFLLWLQGPLNKLTLLYNTQFSLQGLNLHQTLLLVLAGVILGFLGSWFVVNRRLKAIQPH